jgi:hypothetical protein
MTEDAMPDAAPKTAELFDHPVHPVDAAAEAGPGAERTDPKDSGSGRLCTEWRQHAALAVPGNPRCEDQEDSRAYYKRARDEQVAPRYRAGEPAPGMSRERFLRRSTRRSIWPRISMRLPYGSSLA